MAKFRKKPVVIDAIKWDGENIMDIFTFMDPFKPIYVGSQFSNADKIVAIDTLEGRMIANIGDWIIRGVHEEFYPCKPDIFEKTYEPVEAQESKGEAGKDK